VVIKPLQRVGGIKAIFRYMGAEDPGATFPKVVRQISDQDVSLNMPHWMHDDALDAMVDFLASSIWDFPEGMGRPGRLKKACSHWRMFTQLVQLDNPQEIKWVLPEDAVFFDYWTYFKNLAKIHEGEVREVKSKWSETFNRPPSPDKSMFHCQYALDHKQRSTMEGFGCPGTTSKIPKGQEGTTLSQEAIQAIGTTSVCKVTCLQELPCWANFWKGGVTMTHAKKIAVVMNYPRFLCFQVMKGGIVGLHVAECWWKVCPTICLPKYHWNRPTTKGAQKGQGTTSHSSNGWASSSNGGASSHNHVRGHRGKGTPNQQSKDYDPQWGRKDRWSKGWRGWQEH
jgi:hypothetical protein